MGVAAQLSQRKPGVSASLGVYGPWAIRVLSFIALFWFARADLLLWPVFPNSTIPFLALAISICGVWLPGLSFGIFVIAYSLSFAEITFIATPMAVLLGALGLLLFLEGGSEKHKQENMVKLAAVIATPILFHSNIVVFSVIFLGLLLRKQAVTVALFATILGLISALVGGWKIPGLFASRASLMVPPKLYAGTLEWIRRSILAAKWSGLQPLWHRISPEGTVIVPMLALSFAIVYAIELTSNIPKWSETVRSVLSALAAILVSAVALLLISNESHGAAKISVGNLVEEVLFAILALGIAEVLGLLGINKQPEPKSTSQSSSETVPRKASWDEIAGYEDVKAEIREAIEPYTNALLRLEFANQGVPVVRGILLYGPPGTGKTLFARAVASETSLHFISVSGPQFVSKWVGDSERALREIFEEARAHSPSMIFFDEIESILPPREQADGSAGRVDQKVVATFLSEMDGFTERGDVLVIAATNFPDQIDSAALRPGRFDKVIYIPTPDLATRNALFARYLRSKPGSELLEIDKLASSTERFTPADIESVTISAFRSAAQNRSVVTQEKLISLIKNTKPTVNFQMLERYTKLADQFGRREGVTHQGDVIQRTKLTWQSIGGMDEVKEALRQAIELPLTQPELYATWNIKPHKGILLFGPPGCGKTLFAKVVADTSAAKFYTVNGSELAGGGSSSAEANLRSLFNLAEENAPAVIFFDELDAIAGSRDGLLSAFGPTVVNQLLTLLDGKKELKGVVIIAATNRPQTIDPALLRPGRFDKLIYVPLPDLASREQQWQIHMKNRPGYDRIDYATLALESEGYSGAEIAHMVNKVSLERVSLSASGIFPGDISLDELRKVISNSRPSIPYATIAEYETMASSFSR
ncbi:MAG: AAA family ATPase [Acidimicrobiaceae bacterium]|nr:AAA family ATPase [Acidimicrobiaceae bacterium]NNN19986.1 AAA family ATPase [Acidimicrobiaceae bacterium]